MLCSLLNLPALRSESKLFSSSNGQTAYPGFLNANVTGNKLGLTLVNLVRGGAWLLLGMSCLSLLSASSSESKQSESEDSSSSSI